MELIQEADRSKWMVHNNHSIRCFTQGDIERMTNNYRTSLGRGAFGEVYEGILEDDSMVAVKRLIGNMKEEFAKELIIHREINHKNVVRLIGHCVEENALVLVMEYIANGNLNDVLHDDNRSIPLDIRLGIAIECAEALAYMHSHMYTQVIHGDIKPGNILLDSNFHAKLSDFGISRVLNTDKTLYTNNVIGSIGYMDPLFSLDGRLTVKYDVYSFGAVLVELITRKKAVVENVNNVYAFSNALTSGVRGVREMLDVDIASKNNLKVLEGVAKLAGECLRMDRDKRPGMIDVAERLRVLQKSSYQDQERQRVDLFSWGLVQSASVAERILLADASRLADKCGKGCKGKAECRRAVADGLRALGYDASVCKSRWEKAPSYPAGEHEYIDAVVGKEEVRLIVEVDFRSQFELARSTKAYRAALQALPPLFVGTPDRLGQIVAVVAEAARQSLKKKGLHFPPWRKPEYMRAKWLSPHVRCGGGGGDKVVVPGPAVPLSAATPVQAASFSGEFELVFDRKPSRERRRQDHGGGVAVAPDGGSEQESAAAAQGEGRHGAGRRPLSVAW